MKCRPAALFVVANSLFVLAALGFAQARSGSKGNGGHGNSGGGIDSSNPPRNSGIADRNCGRDSNDSAGKNKGKKPEHENRIKGLFTQTGISTDAQRTRYEIERRFNSEL